MRKLPWVPNQDKCKVSLHVGAIDFLCNDIHDSPRQINTTP